MPDTTRCFYCWFSFYSLDISEPVHTSSPGINTILRLCAFGFVYLSPLCLCCCLSVCLSVFFCLEMTLYGWQNAKIQSVFLFVQQAMGGLDGRLLVIIQAPYLSLITFFFFLRLLCPVGIPPMGTSSRFLRGMPAATESHYPTYAVCWMF